LRIGQNLRYQINQETVHSTSLLSRILSNGKKNTRTMTHNPHTGSDFDDFLREEGIYEECNADSWCVTALEELAIAIKRVLARQLAEEMKLKKISN
jgi:hypothetical protein